MIRRLLAVCALAAAFAPSAAAEPKPVVLERDGIRVTFKPSTWVTVDVDGATFSTNSSFYVVKPNWAARFFGFEDDPTLPGKVRVEANGTRMVIPTLGKRGEYEGRMTVEIGPGRSVRFAVDAQVTAEVDATHEHCVGNIAPGWLAGRRITAIDRDGKKVAVTAPALGKLAQGDEAALARNIRRMTMDTRLGPVMLETTGTVKVNLLDYRRNLWFEEKNQFWLGVMQMPLKLNEPLHYELGFAFPPARPAAAAGATVTAGAAVPVAGAIRPEPPRDLIIPTPKQVKWGRRDLALAPGAAIAVAGDSAEKDFAAEQAQLAAADARRQHGASLVAADRADARVLLRILPAAGDWKPEEYRIRVGDRAAVLEAATTAGLVNATATLRQLIRQDGSGRHFIRAAEIRDWPALPFRGIHFFTGKDGRDIQVKMLADVLGAFKINSLVYQCEFIKWTTHPEIHHTTHGMEMADAKAVLAEARRRNIDVTPLINTFGHSEWLVDNPTYRRLAEDPDLPYAYDPSTSEPLRICEDIYGEAIELFRPRYFHIGHDEINPPGFPKREANKKVGAVQLILNDILHYHKFLKERGIRTMIWGDMFLHGNESPDATNATSREEAARLRAALPKDIIVTDWHYAPARPAAYRSLRIFNDDGLDAIASPWFSPANILCFTRAAADEYARGARPGKGRTIGTLQTTWAGYSFGKHSFWEAPNQYAAYLLAAEAAWTGGGENPDAVPFNYRAEFNRAWYGDNLPRTVAPGWVADLGGASNFAVDAKAGAKWLDYDTGHGALRAKGEAGWLGRFRVSPKTDNGAPRGVLLKAALNPAGAWPSRLVVPVQTTATLVHLALAATFSGAPAPEIARMRVSFADGATAEMNLDLGETVFAFEDTRVKPDSPVIWTAPGDARTPLRVIHATLWKNPHPQKIIREIEFVSSERGSGLVVFGVGGTW